MEPEKGAMWRPRILPTSLTRQRPVFAQGSQSGLVHESPSPPRPMSVEVGTQSDTPERAYPQPHANLLPGSIQETETAAPIPFAHCSPTPRELRGGFAHLLGEKLL